MIVVLDTNVWISALVFSGATPILAVTKAIETHTIAIADELEQEIVRVLTENFGWETQRAELQLEIALRNAIRVTLHGTLRLCRDPKDDMFLECAELAGADLLVAGDKDLLVLGSYKKTHIITPKEYVDG